MPPNPMTSKKTVSEPATGGGATEAGTVAPETLSFEEAVERLEDIVRRMEEEQMPLDQLIRDYEAGTGLLRACRARVETARARIEQIGNVTNGGGEITLEDFEPGAEETAGAAGAPKIRLL